MDFGVVLQCDPPARELVALSRQAERLGFSHVWTYDSHVLWQEPFVIYSQILAATERVFVGPMVTNPATRDWTVTASLFATLNEMFGNRTVCGIGRGDSAVRVIGGQPSTVGQLRDCVEVVRELANGRCIRYQERDLQLTWAADSNLDVWVAAYGPRVLAVVGEVGDGYILQLADPDIAAWMIGAVSNAAKRAGRDPDALKFCVAAPAYVGDDLAHQREQTRWFGRTVGNHVAEIVARYGGNGIVPRALTDYITGRGNSDTDFVPDEVIDRFCLLGPVDAHIKRLDELRELGVDQFALYLQHDAKESTLAAYGEHVIPALNP